jgi:hypothetical protein
MTVNLGALPSVSTPPPASVPPASVPPAVSPAPTVEGGDAGRAGDAAPPLTPETPATVPPASESEGAPVNVAPRVSARVASIVYAARKRDLLVTLKLVNGARKALPGVSVSIAISRNGVQYRAVAHTRRADGKATYRLRLAPRGCYSTKVRRVAARGWDRATPQNRFCK